MEDIRYSFFSQIVLGCVWLLGKCGKRGEKVGGSEVTLLPSAGCELSELWFLFSRVPDGGLGCIGKCFYFGKELCS